MSFCSINLDCRRCLFNSCGCCMCRSLSTRRGVCSGKLVLCRFEGWWIGGDGLDGIALGSYLNMYSTFFMFVIGSSPQFPANTPQQNPSSMQPPQPPPTDSPFSCPQYTNTYNDIDSVHSITYFLTPVHNHKQYHVLVDYISLNMDLELLFIILLFFYWREIVSLFSKRSGFVRNGFFICGRLGWRRSSGHRGRWSLGRRRIITFLGIFMRRLPTYMQK